MIRLKLNNPIEEFCVGIYYHAIEKITINTETEEQTHEEAQRMIIGFLIFSIEIIW